MEFATIVTERGKINISRITLEALIRLILLDVEGISRPKRRRFRKIIQQDNVDNNTNINQDIKVEIKTDSIAVNLFLFINYGVRIPDLTWEAQSKVKERIKEITSIDIEQINVHIQGVIFSKKFQDKRNFVNQGNFLKIF